MKYQRKPIGKETVDTPGGKSYEIDLYHDPKLVKMASYLLKINTALAGMGKGYHFPDGFSMEVYSSRIPVFTRTSKGAYFSGVTVPLEGEKYRIILDERLKPYEQIATLYHELGHIAGGYKTSDRNAQKIAIHGLSTLIKGYETFSDPTAMKTIKRELGVDFNPREIPEVQLRQALQYAIQSGTVFGVNASDLREIGLDVGERGNSGGLERILGFILLFIGSFILLSAFSSLTGFVVSESSFTGVDYFIGLFMFILGILLIFINKIISKSLR